MVNPDGLGYLKLLPHNFAAGHLLYMPLLRAATHLFGGDGLRAGRFVNAMLGGTGVVLTYGIVRRALFSLPLGRPFSAADIRFAATFAAAGLALSYGYWVQGADLEVYAAAMVALLSTVRLLLAYQVRPTAPRALAVGVLLGVAVLCHLEHVLLTPFVAAWVWSYAPAPRSRVPHVALAVGTGGAIAIAAYAWATLVVRGHDLSGALGWIATAQHGFPYGGGLYRVADAIYGLAKAIVYSPYLFESDAQRLLGQFLLGLAPLVALGIGAFAGRRALPPLQWRLWSSWVAPYAAFGVVFFGSDTERWLFVLPALWLLAAVTLALHPGRARVAVWVLAYLAAANLGTGIWPAHRESSPTRARAEAASRLLHDGDLLIFPGHSWDEYVSYYAAVKVEPFPVAYYAARDGLPACWVRLDREIAAAEARGGQVLVVRVFDEDDPSPNDPRGFDELSALGLSKNALRERLRAIGRPVTVGAAVPSGDGTQVVRLDSTPGAVINQRQ